MAQGLLATACNSNCSNSTIKLLILLTNSSLDDFDGARFNTNNNTNDANFTILPYAMHGKINDCIMYIFSLFFSQVISHTSLLGPSYSNILDIGDYYTSFIMSRSVSSSNILSSDFNSEGGTEYNYTSTCKYFSFVLVLCLTLSRNIIISDIFRAVLTMRMPWQQLFIGIEMAVIDRPSSYYMILQGDGEYLHNYIMIIIIIIIIGRMMYHSRYPSTYVYDIDPMTIENNEAFPTILSAILK